MGQYQVDVTIKGTAPLLQHRFGQAAITEAQSVKKRTGEMDYSEEWRDTVYADEDGWLYEPATHLESAMIKAAVSFKIKGRRGKTYKDLVKAAVYVEPEMIPLNVQIPENPTSNPLEPFYVDIRPVIISRARVLRARGALAKGWELIFTISVIDDQLASTVLKEILDEAGRAVGIGDYRPRFGRFITTRFEVQDGAS